MAFPTNSAKGIDLSKHNVTTADGVVHHYQHKQPLDFVGLRSTIGLLRDVAFLSLLEDVTPIPVKFAWHYDDVELPWEKQVDNLVAATAGLSINFFGWDYEKGGNILTAKTDENARRAMQMIEDRTGKECLLYSQLSVISEMFNRGAKWVLQKKLWVARWFGIDYFSNTATSPYTPAKPTWATKEFYDAAHWTLWQYGGDKLPAGANYTIPGRFEGEKYGVLSKSIELDVYHGTLDQLRQEFGVIGDVPPAPDEPIELNTEQRLFRIEEWIRSHGGF